jgi:iron complex outermembrane receptor protein
MVRGFGSDSVPVFVDGIAVSAPYRGEGDAARILTGDLEEIEINKGFSSPLLGANTLGGAIQIRTARPKRPFEASTKTSVDFDSIMHYAGLSEVLSVGTKLPLFYGKATFQYRGVDHFRLPDSFTPYDDKPPREGGNPQKEGDRLWSDSRDYKLSVLAGFTPVDALDFNISYTMQIADKGLSPPSVKGGRDGYAIWEWPRWDRHSIAANYAYYDDEKLYIKGFTYFDKYDNRLDQYYQWSMYERGKHMPSSDYDEYAFGQHLEAGYDFNSTHKLQAALTFKHEDHKGLSGDIELVHISEDTWSFGTEYTFRPVKQWSFTAGVGFDALYPRDFSSRLNDEMELLGENYYIVKSKSRMLLSAVAGVFYDINDSHELHLSFARKNHFPTMFQRHSTRFGEVLPNPRLGAEFANHYELGYKGYLFEKLTVNTAVYYSEITGKITRVRIANPVSPDISVEYSVNLDKVATYGFEASLLYYPFEWLQAGGSFGLNKYEIVQSRLGAKALTYYPEYTFNLFAEIKFLSFFTAIPSLLYTGERYYNAEATETLDAYTLCNFKIKADLGEHVSVSVSIENIFDQLYEIRENFPLAGRTYSLSLTAKY